MVDVTDPVAMAAIWGDISERTGLDLYRIRLSQADIDRLESTQFNVDQICQVYSVPAAQIQALSDRARERCTVQASAWLEICRETDCRRQCRVCGHRCARSTA